MRRDNHMLVSVGLVIAVIATLAGADCPAGFSAGPTHTCDCTANSIPCSALTTECLCSKFDCQVKDTDGTIAQSDVGLFATFNATVSQEDEIPAAYQNALIGAMKGCYTQYVDARSATANSVLNAECTPVDGDKYGKPPYSGIDCCSGLVLTEEPRTTGSAAVKQQWPTIHMCRKPVQPVVTPIPPVVLQKWDIRQGHRIATDAEHRTIGDTVQTMLQEKFEMMVNSHCPADKREIEVHYKKQWEHKHLEKPDMTQGGEKRRFRLSREFNVHHNDSSLLGASIMGVEIGCCWNSMSMFKATQRTNATASDVVYSLDGGIRFPKATEAGAHGCGTRDDGADVKTCCISATNPSNSTMFLAVDHAFRVGLTDAKFTKGQDILTAEWALSNMQPPI